MQICLLEVPVKSRGGYILDNFMMYSEENVKVLIDTDIGDNIGAMFDYAILKFKQMNQNIEDKDWLDKANLDDRLEKSEKREDGVLDYHIVVRETSGDIKQEGGYRTIFRASTRLLHPSVRFAMNLANTFHENQKRKGDGLPYIIHLMEISRLFFEDIFIKNKDEKEKENNPIILITAARGHDLIEDTTCPEEMIESFCGEEAFKLIKSVSQDKDLEDKKDWEKKKLKYIESVKNGGKNSIILSIADKVVNMRSLLRQYKIEGEAIREKFNRGKNKKLWFEKECLKMSKESDCPDFLVSEYESLINELETIEEKLEKEGKVIDKRKNATENVTTIRKRAQINASGAGGDIMTIEITNYPTFIHEVLTKIDSKGNDWKVYYSYGDDEYKNDLSLMLHLGYKEEPVNIIIIDKDNNKRQFSF